VCGSRNLGVLDSLGERGEIGGSTVEPAFVVFHSGSNVAPGKFLVVGCVGVAFETGLDE
jgi:hypothetical protein